VACYEWRFTLLTIFTAHHCIAFYVCNRGPFPAVWIKLMWFKVLVADWLNNLPSLMILVELNIKLYIMHVNYSSSKRGFFIGSGFTCHVGKYGTLSVYWTHCILNSLWLELPVGFNCCRPFCCWQLKHHGEAGNKHTCRQLKVVTVRRRPYTSWELAYLKILSTFVVWLI